MSRLRADLLLILVALIWGGAFVAQKDALAHVGPFTFVAARFALSALLLLPLALWETRRMKAAPKTAGAGTELALLCLVFFAAISLQQAGLLETSVTNAGFLTGLYVVFTPLICRAVYRQRLSPLVLPAALLSVLGVWLLSGSANLSIGRGDALVLLCAAAFAWHIVLVGKIMQRTQAPFRLCFLQYAAVAALAGVAALATEEPSLSGLMGALSPILYAGAVSGGIAYTLQVVAQQHTPSSDSAVIMSAEALFAALFGVALRGDRLSAYGWAGCALIFLAILLVEFGPFLKRKLRPQP